MPARPALSDGSAVPTGIPFCLIKYATIETYVGPVSPPGASSGIVLRICSTSSKAFLPAHLSRKSALLSAPTAWHSRQRARNHCSPMSTCWAATAAGVDVVSCAVIVAGAASVVARRRSARTMKDVQVTREDLGGVAEAVLRAQRVQPAGRCVPIAFAPRGRHLRATPRRTVDTIPPMADKENSDLPRRDFFRLAGLGTGAILESRHRRRRRRLGELDRLEPAEAGHQGHRRRAIRPGELARDERRRDPRHPLLLRRPHRLRRALDGVGARIDQALARLRHRT